MGSRVWDVDRLRFAVEAAGVGLWSWNVDTDQIILDERAFRIWGVEPKDSVTFEELSARIHPEDLDKVRAAFASTRETLGEYETDFRTQQTDGIRWISARGRGDDVGIVGRMMYGIFIDVTVRKLAEEARELITGEMNHRIKNLFALTHALARISSRTTNSKEEMTNDLMERLTALSTAHNLIRPSFNEQSSAGELRELLATLLKPYMNGHPSEGRLTVTVPSILVGEHSATAIALIIHELATNSLKYGALSSEVGKLQITGDDQSDYVLIKWIEQGGPSSDTHAPGFGSKLVESSVKDSLGGSMVIDWPIEGIVISLTLNKSRLGA